MYLIDEAIKINNKVGTTDNAPFPNETNVFLAFQLDAIRETKIPPIKKTAIRATTV